MISETCACGASFQAERADELELWEDWLARHACSNRKEFGGSLDSRLERSDSFIAEDMRPVGFRPDTDDY